MTQTTQSKMDFIPDTQMMSAEIKELMTALAVAQGQLGGASKDSSNPFYKSKYADLASVWEACRLPLSKNGLSVTQFPQNIGNEMCLITILGHASGQWIKSVTCLPIEKFSAQDIGKCITYFRRYALAAIVGVYQEDDDAEGITTHQTPKEHTPKEHKKTTPISQNEKGPLIGKISAAIRNNERLKDEIFSYYGKSSLPDFNEGELRHCVKMFIEEEAVNEN